MQKKKSNLKKISQEKRVPAKAKLKTNKKQFQKRSQKKIVEKSSGQILVSRGGVRPSNILNLRDGEVVLENTELERPVLKELTWRDYNDTSKLFNREDPNNEIGEVNFVIKEKKPSFIINLLADLPKDFIFFYKKKIKVLFQITQWTLEEIGKIPFRLVFSILSAIELYLIRPLFGQFFKIIRAFCWTIRIGSWEIINFPKKAFLFFKPAPALSWSKNILAFAVLCLVIILPFGAYMHILKLKNAEGVVLGVTSEAYEYLQAAQTATKNLDFKEANDNFKKANDNFLLAQNEINELNFLISSAINIFPKGVAAQKILVAGQAISEAGVYMTAGLDVINQKNIKTQKQENKNDDVGVAGINDVNKLVNKIVNNDGLMVRHDSPQVKVNNGLISDELIETDNQPLDQDTIVNNVDLGVGDKVKLLQENFSKAYPKIVLARKNLEEVKPEILPEENRENFIEIKNKVINLEAVCKKLFSFSKIINELLAIDDSKRYLVIFQNEQEIRPTGGFIGSFALLDIKDGVIKQIEVPGGGPYDMAGSLLKRVAPPIPLQLINNQWQMQDANWFADFSESAKKIMWFYENSGGATVDGVIGITSGLIPELLEITGPIEMEEYDKIINKDNFYIETQMAVEIEYDIIENRPKKFIADLTPKLLEKIINIPSDKLIDLLGIVDFGLTNKKVTLYFSDATVQKEVLANNWAGEIKQVGDMDDYFLAVNSNMGGGKTDGVIDQKIIHETEIDDNGFLVDTVTIIRSHNGGPGYFFANKRNVDYLRIYAPKGSVLLEAKGFSSFGPEYFRELAPNLSQDKDLERIEGLGLIDETTGTRITNEFGKTVFGNWLILDPGETVISKIKYRLPWVLNFGNEQELKDVVYTLLIQKQPGSKEHKIEKMIFLPEGLNLTWKYPESDYIGEYNGTVKFRSSLDGDKYYGVLFR